MNGSLQKPLFANSTTCRVCTGIGSRRRCWKSTRRCNAASHSTLAPRSPLAPIQVALTTHSLQVGPCFLSPTLRGLGMGFDGNVFSTNMRCSRGSRLSGFSSDSVPMMVALKVLTRRVRGERRNTSFHNQMREYHNGSAPSSATKTTGRCVLHVMS